MNDEASKALFLNKELLQKGQGICFADENFVIDFDLPSMDLTLISNRIDITQDAKLCAVKTKLSDFDTSSIADETLDYILLRLPKSKQLIRYLIAESMRILTANGILVLAGNNQEGVKNVIKSTEKRLGMVREMLLLGKGLRYAEIIKLNPFAKNIQDNDYLEVVDIKMDSDIHFISKPGVYGFDKIDQGSLFLSEVLRNIRLKGDLLDLGCGYGYLSIMMKNQPDVTSITATDNNITAIDMCQRNFEVQGIVGNVIIDDCAKTFADNRFKTIICNPPFHQGFSTSSDLTKRFIETTKRLLKRNGRAYYVVNRFISIEKVCEETKVRFSEIARNSHFKILEITL